MKDVIFIVSVLGIASLSAASLIFACFRIGRLFVTTNYDE